MTYIRSSAPVLFSQASTRGQFHQDMPLTAPFGSGNAAPPLPRDSHFFTATTEYPVRSAMSFTPTGSQATGPLCTVYVEDTRSAGLLVYESDTLES